MIEAKTEKRKKTYLKPEAHRFPLRPEEAVLGSCKSAVTAGAHGGNCKVLGPCNVAGS